MRYNMAYVRENFHFITKMWLNQFGGAFLGLMVSLAVSSSENNTLVLLSAIFSALFYVYLQYTVMWDLGARDIIRVQGNRAEYHPLTGLKMSLVANIPNIILALLIVIGYIFGSQEGSFGYDWAGTLYVVSKGIAVVWEAMYNGFVQLYSPHNPIIFVFMIVPALAAATAGYYLGTKNFRVLGLFGIRPKPPKK